MPGAALTRDSRRKTEFVPSQDPYIMSQRKSPIGAGLGHMPIFGPNMMCKEIPCWPELGHMSITVTKGMCDVCVMSVTNQL